MSIKIMATIGYNLEISSNVSKLWELPENEKRISHILNTRNNYVLVDRETFMSDSFKLSNNVFVLGDKVLENVCDVICYDSVEAVCERFENNDETLWVMGAGTTFYKNFMDKAVVMDITEVYEYKTHPYAYFPFINDDEWDIECVEKCENDIVYYNQIYKRKVRMR